MSRRIWAMRSLRSAALSPFGLSHSSVSQAKPTPAIAGWWTHLFIIAIWAVWAVATWRLG